MHKAHLDELDAGSDLTQIAVVHIADDVQADQSDTLSQDVRGQQEGSIVCVGTAAAEKCTNQRWKVRTLRRFINA